MKKDNREKKEQERTNHKKAAGSFSKKSQHKPAKKKHTGKGQEGHKKNHNKDTHHKNSVSHKRNASDQMNPESKHKKNSFGKANPKAKNKKGTSYKAGPENKHKKGTSFKVNSEAKQISEKRQAILDDPEIKFIFDPRENIVHDRSCPLAAKITDRNLRYTKNYPAHIRQCPECAKKAYIRNGAYDFINYQRYADLYQDMNVDESQLYHIYVECRMKTTVSPGRLNISYLEDSWIIQKLHKSPDDPAASDVCLFHNNYTIEDGKREFDGGYHVQNGWMDQTTFQAAIHYIENYHWTMAHVDVDSSPQKEGTSFTSNDPEALKHALKKTGERLVDANSKLKQADSKLKKTDSKLQKADSALKKTDSRLKNVDQKLKQKDAALKKTDLKLKKVNSALENADQRIEHLEQQLNQPWYQKLGSLFRKKEEETATLPYQIQINDFMIPDKDGYPNGGARCLYLWKGKDGQTNWQVGLYNSRRGNFEVSYGNKRIFCSKEKILAWKSMSEINVTEHNKA